MQPKPDFLGPQFATRFQDQSVVDRYHLRPTCPPETFSILAGIISDEPRAVLDVGCGTGDVARNLLDFVQPIDAVDISLPMMEKRHLFQRIGETQTSPAPFSQPLSDYIEAFHAKSSLSRDNMTVEAAAAFDEEMREILTPFARNGEITVQVVGHVAWGKPLGANT